MDNFDTEVEQAVAILRDKGYDDQRIKRFLEETVIVGKLRFWGTRGTCEEIAAEVASHCFTEGIPCEIVPNGGGWLQKEYLALIRGNVFQIDDARQRMHQAINRRAIFV